MSLQSDRLDEFHSCTAEHPPSLNSTINSAVANIDNLCDATNYITKSLAVYNTLKLLFYGFFIF